MAEALTRQGSRRSKTPDARERELKRLRLSVCDEVGFRLYLATYDQPKRRDELITRVIKEAEAEKVRVTRLDLSEAGPETDLVGLLRAHLRETELPPGWRQAVMVTDIEQHLDYSAGPKGFVFLHQANLLRDALPGAAPMPVVLWLSRVASAALPAEAPDLWHWRAANFDFTGDKAPRVELLRELMMLQPLDEGGLSGEQRQVRMRMLTDLLAEIEREGPPRSKRQKAERAELLAQLVVEEVHLGRAAEAIPRIEWVLEYARQIDDRKIEATGLVLLGGLCAQLGQEHRAIEHLEKALAIAREIGDRGIEGNALRLLGDVYTALDETQRAIAYYEQGLAIAREVGDRQGEGRALFALGNASDALGETQQAIEYYEQRLAIARKLGDRQGEEVTTGRLGLAYAALGEFQRAIGPLEQQLAVAREIGDRRGEGRALGNLGIAYAGLGELPQAMRHFEQSRRIAREIEDRHLEAISLLSSAYILDLLGERNEAIRQTEEALRIYEQIGSPWQEKARAQLAEWQGEGSG